LSGLRPLKLAVVTPIPTPYRDGFWNVLAAREDVDVVVYYCAAGKGDRPWSGDWPRSFRHEVLPGRNLMAWRGADASAWDNPGITSRLKAETPDAVLIGGYNHPTMLRAMRHCIRLRVPYFLMCESHLQNARSPARRLLKDRLVRWTVANMAGGLPTGQLASDYLRHYGAHSSALVFLPNVPDVENIEREARQLRSDRTSLKRDLELPAGPLLLFAGRLISRKGANRVIEALANMPADLSAAILGDGPERSTLEQQVRVLGLADRVYFAGFVEPAEMIQWYAAADLFVLPSQETWGVVVIEALSAGLPVVVSQTVGCHPDVVVDSALGEVVDSASAGALAEALERVLAQSTDGEKFDAAWQQLAPSLRYETQAEQLTRHVRSHIGVREPA